MTCQRETLERWVRRPKTAQALALRARMILGCDRRPQQYHGGHPSWECPMRRWGNGVPGSWNGGWTDCRTIPRSGRPRAVTDDDVVSVVGFHGCTLETAPRDATHWSTRSMAAAQRAEPQRRVSRIWRAFQDCSHTARRPSSCRRTPSSVEKVSGRCGAIPESTGSGVGPVRGREVPDPGVGSHPSAIAHAPGTSGTAHP